MRGWKQQEAKCLRAVTKERRVVREKKCCPSEQAARKAFQQQQPFQWLLTAKQSL